jgi:hypothetical protein
MKNDDTKQTNIKTTDDENIAGYCDHTNFDVGCKGRNKGEKSTGPAGWADL